MLGGAQEFGLRAGTENLPAVWAAALAVELALVECAAFIARTRELSRSFWRQLQSVLPAAHLNGPRIDSAQRLPNTLNVSLPGVESRVIVTLLDLAGLECSAGSACASGSLEPSHVLKAMGRDDEAARAALRFSFGRTSGPEDVDNAVESLRSVVAIHGASRSVSAD
jgi:cysteine desulfurase